MATGAAGGSGTVAVTATWGCPWYASSNANFVEITSAAAGTSSGTVAYSVAANQYGKTRSATLFIADQSLTITQAALPAGTVGTLNLNGDADRDIFTYNPLTGAWSIEKSQTAGSASPGFSSSGGTWSPDWIVRSADFDADGLTDFFLYNQTTGVWFKVTNNGVGGFSYYHSSWSPNWTMHVMDLNGDAKSDVFLYNVSTGQWFKCVSTGRGTGEFSYVSGWWSPGWELYPVDFNGDGMADLFLYSRDSTQGRIAGQWLWATNDGGNGFTFATGSLWSPFWEIYPGDFDGDGLTDIFLYYGPTGASYLCTNMGQPGWFTYKSAEMPSDFTAVRVGYFDDNATADLFFYRSATGLWRLVTDVAKSTYYTSQWSPGWQVHVTDFNQDGLSDLLLYNARSGQWAQVFSSGLPGTFTYGFGTWDRNLTIVAGGVRLP